MAIRSLGHHEQQQLLLQQHPDPQQELAPGNGMKPGES